MNKYIVSLTTIPSKFDYLPMTIDSIIQQTISPLMVILNIPKIYDFRLNNTELPKEKLDDFMNKYEKHNVIINYVEKDNGPGTKLLGLLNSNILENIEDIHNTFIVIIDDDLIYKPYMFDYFDGITYHYNIQVASYIVSFNHSIRVGQGSDGIFIRLSLLDKFMEYYNVIKDCDYVNYHDDIYISYYFHLLNKDIEYIIPPNNCLIYDVHPNTDIDALRNIPGKYSRENLNNKVYEVLDELNKKGAFTFLLS